MMSLSPGMSRACRRILLQGGLLPARRRPGRELPLVRQGYPGPRAGRPGPGGAFRALCRELSSFRSVTISLEVERYLERLSKEGVRLTAGQTAEVLNELTGSRGATLSTRDPGTAKTSTLKVIERFNEEVLVPQGREHISINPAYTGKAA